MKREGSGAGQVHFTNGSGSGSREAQKHADPGDPFPDPDPEHWTCLIWRLLYWPGDSEMLTTLASEKPKTRLISRLVYWPGDPLRYWRHLHQKSHDTPLILHWLAETPALGSNWSSGTRFTVRTEGTVQHKRSSVYLLSLLRSQCCGSGMFIPDPDFYPSRIPDLKTAMKDRVEKNFVVIAFFGAINFTKLYFLFLKCWRKKLGPIFKEL